MLPIPRPVTTVADGAVHVPGWLDAAGQERLLAACRDWSVGMQQIAVRNGVMSVRTVCLGWHWQPYRYTRTRPDGRAVPELPSWLVNLGAEAALDAGYPDFVPDVAIVNFYDAKAKMGLHQDRDERSSAPVVSLSLGDTGAFRLGNTENRSQPWTDVPLESGDLFVFGGASRLAFHGVTRIRPGTSPLDLTGRLNVTMRESGL